MRNKIPKGINDLCVMFLMGFFILSCIPSGYLEFSYAQQPGQTLAEEATDKKDSGLVSLNFKDTDMRDVLNIIAYKGGVNIVAGDDVDVKVTVKLEDVYWEQALDVILKTYNCTYRKEKNLIRVMSLQRSLEEEGKVPLATKIIPLNFARVEKLKESLGKMLSKRGNIAVDTRTNSLVITDIPDAVKEVEIAAQELDSRTPQVLIEAMMVDIKITDEDHWGSFWDLIDGDNSYQHSLLGEAPGGQYSFIKTAGDDTLNLTINALRKQNKAKILANPRVLTLDNQEAKIEITEEVPYLETVDSGSGTTTNVKFKEAGIKLYVTPHITSGQYISMNVKPEQSFKSDEEQGQPIIDSRKAETNLLVKDGETIIIGGLRQTKDNVTFDKVPIMGDIPFFGLFFRQKITAKIETELVLFVTPHIIRESTMTDREVELLAELGQREHLTIDERTEMERLKDLFNKVGNMVTTKKDKTKKVIIPKRIKTKKEPQVDAEINYPKDSAISDEDKGLLNEKVAQLKKTLEILQDEVEKEAKSKKRKRIR